jgi:hypothetical protein
VLARGAMAAGLLGAVRLLERERGVAGDRDQEVELVVRRPPARDRLAERDDREDLALGVDAGDEQLVARAPCAGVDLARGRRHVTGADAFGIPVDRAVGHEVGAPPQEALVEHEPDPRRRVGLAEQLLPHRLGPHDRRGLVVVPLRAVDVDHHAGEAHRLGEHARDRREHRWDALVAADQARDLHQALEPADGVQVLRGHTHS